MSISGSDNGPVKRAHYDDLSDTITYASSQIGFSEDGNFSTRATISSFPGYISNVRVIDPNTLRDFAHIQQLLLGRRNIPAVVAERYNTLNQLADNVRLHNVPAPNTVGTTNIRFIAHNQSGANRGFGADELLMTSQTNNFFRRTAGMETGVEAHSSLQDGTHFSWLDAQFHGRVPTAMVLLRNGNGHVGALFRHATTTASRGGQLVAGQPGFHHDRQVQVQNSSTPLVALYRALNFTRAETVSVAELVAGEMYTRATFNVFDEDMQDSVQRRRFAYDLEALRNNMVFSLALIRDQMSPNEVAEIGQQPSLLFSDVDAEPVTIEDLGPPPMQNDDLEIILPARK